MFSTVLFPEVGGGFLDSQHSYVVSYGGYDRGSYGGYDRSLCGDYDCGLGIICYWSTN